MKAPLEYGKYYHIFNRGNNYDNLFLNKEDYIYFLKLYDIYINSIADTFAWCLMKNHFHILVRIKEEKEIGFFNSANSQSKDFALKWKTYFTEKPDKNYTRKPVPVNQFQHLFNAYARQFNIRHNRISSLFEDSFERIPVDDEKYFKNLILYIHNNPVTHGFVDSVDEYQWTSYLSILSLKSTKLMREEVIEYFNDIDNFKFLHNKPQNDDLIKHLIIE